MTNRPAGRVAVFAFAYPEALVDLLTQHAPAVTGDANILCGSLGAATR